MAALPPCKHQGKAFTAYRDRRMTKPMDCSECNLPCEPGKEMICFPERAATCPAREEPDNNVREEA